MVTCPYCGTENKPDALECINCTATMVPGIEISTGEQGKFEFQDEKEESVDAQFLEDIAKEKRMAGSNNEMMDEKSLTESNNSENLEHENANYFEGEAETSQEEKPESLAESDLSLENELPVDESSRPVSVPSFESENQASDELQPTAFDRAEEILKSTRIQSREEEELIPVDEPVLSPESHKNRYLAIGLEFIGLLGVLGIGWLYAGNVLVGVLALVAFGIWNLLAIALDLITFGIFLCIHVPANLIIIAASVYLIYRYTGDRPAVFE